MARHDNDTTTSSPDLHGGRMRVPRSRGALSGVLLIVLGAWGALIPLIGPAANFGLTPDKTFHFTKARFWLEVLPGAVTVVGGVLLLLAANRVVTSFGAWLGVAGGAWFVVGPTLARLLHLGSLGSPIKTGKVASTLEYLLLFTGLGALILFLGALAVGRLGVVSVRDVRAAQRREQEQAEQQRREAELTESRRRDHELAEQQRRQQADNERQQADNDRQQAERQQAEQQAAEQQRQAQLAEQQRQQQYAQQQAAEQQRQQPAYDPNAPAQPGYPDQQPPSGGATRL